MSQTFPKDTPAINKHMIKMFYIIVGMQVETAVRFPIENIGMATAKMPPHSQCCEDRKNWNFATPLMRMWRSTFSLEKPPGRASESMEFTSDPLIPRTWLRRLKIYYYAKACTKMVPAVLFIIARGRGQYKCPSAGEYVSKCGISLQEGTNMPSRTNYRLQHGVTLKTQSTRSFTF